MIKKTADSGQRELTNQILSNLSSPLTAEEKEPEPVRSAVQEAAPVKIIQEQNLTAKSSEPEETDKNAESTSKAKTRYADTVNLNLPSGKRNEIKEFFNTYHLSMTQGILFAINYLREDVKAGKIEISKLGVERLQ